MVVDEATIRHFATLAGTHYPIHEDERYAWSQGYPTILVQGLLLFMTQLYYAGVRAGRPGGDVVPAGGAGREPARVVPEQH